MHLRTVSDRYRGPADLPERIAVFPLRGAILLPRATLPLNVFEPRYLQMIDDVLSTSRVLGIVQPQGGDQESPPGKAVKLRATGCAGRIVAYQEVEDNRVLITLAGITRCSILEEVPIDKPYRVCTVSYERFLDDFDVGAGETEVDREGLLRTLKSYLDAHDLRADWPAISQASNEALVNALAIASAFGSEEKQALLEARDLKSRAETLIALAQMELAARAGGSGSTLQ